MSGGDPAALGLWGALLQKLQSMLDQSAKFNLLLTQVSKRDLASLPFCRSSQLNHWTLQVITTLAQYTPPLWRCYVFSLSSGKNAGVITLSGTSCSSCSPGLDLRLMSYACHSYCS